MKNKLIYKRLVATILSLVFMCTVAMPVYATEAVEKKNEQQNLFYVEDFFSYKEYLEQYGEVKDASSEVFIECSNYSDTLEKKEIEKLNCSIIEQDGVAEYTFTVSESGFYNLKLCYYPIESTSSSIKLDLKIDGAHPFEDTANLNLSRVWGFSEERTKDTQDNDIRCNSVEIPEWIEYTLENETGGEAFKFYLEAGEHTVQIESLQNSFALESITFTAPQEIKSYEEVLKEWEKSGAKDAEKNLELLQAEEAVGRSDESIAMKNDRMSAATTPYHSYKIRYNYIGGNTWSTAGQWIEWDVDVKESGLYTLAFRYLQNEKTEDISTRSLTVDNQLPFKEAANIAFSYDSAWQTMFVGNGEEPYKFYLEEGVHTLRMTVALGETAGIIADASTILDRLNNIYVDIVMVTGTEPDTNRDYGIKKLLPEVLEEMKLISEALKALEIEQNEIKGDEKGNTTFERLYIQLDKMLENPEDIPRRLSNFQTNVTALGTWINTSRTQPLGLDYLQVMSPMSELPDAESGFFASLWHHICQFFGSFVIDYAEVGSSDVNANRKITVWISSGRDQADIIRKIINTNFTPNYGVEVDLQLVSAGALLPATLADIGPDVFIGVAETEPVNYALRNAVVDLSKLEGYDEVKKRFHSASSVAFELDGGVYALPETMDYPMLFYRKDILSELGIKESDLKQWDTLLQNVLPELMLSYFDFGMMPDAKNFEMLLYQYGGRLYNESNNASALDSTEAFSAFNTMTRLYTDYKIPKSYDFANRFRSGQMPLAIANYSAYNQLSVFAPEIEGKWGMTVLPGVVDEEGNINNTAVTSVSGSIILKNSDCVDDAWTFLKWWSQGEVQSEYANELESILGPAARLSTANLEALESIQWSYDIKKSLKAQQENLVGVPQIAGSYYTSRHFTFAYRDVVEKGENTRESLLEACEDITIEIQDKRKEFYGEED